MNKKVILIISALTVLTFIIYNYRLDIIEYFHSRHVIYWSKNVKIDIEDYKSEPDKKSELNISSYHGFYYKAYDVETAYVKSFFDKNKSWIKDSNDIYLQEDLKMEILVFDLYECYARRFNHEIDLIRNDNSKSITDVENIGEDLYFELEKITKKIFNNDLTYSEQHELWRPIIDKMLLDTEKLNIHDKQVP